MNPLKISMIKPSVQIHVSLSIIIPTLNESDNLATLLPSIKRQEGVMLEILIADGGSNDRTKEVAEKNGALFVPSSKGRAVQMNCAAKRATGDLLLFMHADSELEKSEFFLADALQTLLNIEKKLGHKRVAGHFSLQFRRTRSGNKLAFQYMEEKTAFNRVNTTNGDQGFLLRREFFDDLDGFDQELPFLEDQKLAEKIRIKGFWITLPGVLFTSARRFEKEGVYRRYILMGIIMGLHSTEVNYFFKRAKDVYKSQHETSKLLLWPFFSIIWQMLRFDLGFLGSVRAWFFVGRYIRSNSWQLFYLFDIITRSFFKHKSFPFLRFHDIFFAPLTNFSFFDAVTGGLAFFWFMLVLGPWFWLVDTKIR